MWASVCKQRLSYCALTRSRSRDRSRSRSEPTFLVGVGKFYRLGFQPGVAEYHPSTYSDFGRTVKHPLENIVRQEESERGNVEITPQPLLSSARYTSSAPTHGDGGPGLPVRRQRLPGGDLQHEPVVLVAGHEGRAPEPAPGVGAERRRHQGAAGLRRSWAEEWRYCRSPDDHWSLDTTSQSLVPGNKTAIVWWLGGILSSVTPSLNICSPPLAYIAA